MVAVLQWNKSKAPVFLARWLIRQAVKLKKCGIQGIGVNGHGVSMIAGGCKL